MSTNSERFLSFCLGAEEYAIPLLSVREVIEIPEITPVPFTPPHFLGIMNLRGQVISVIDLRSKLGLKPKDTGRTAVIICELNPICLGVVVDSITSVVSPKTEEISERPEILSSKASNYITSVFRKGKQLILLLDIGKALDLADQKAIQTATKTEKAA